MTELEQRLRTIAEEKNTKLLPTNLKEGVTCLGIRGTAKLVNNQNKKITENGIYMPDEGYTGLGAVVVEVVDGSLDEVINIQDEIIATQQTQIDALVLKLEGKARPDDATYTELFGVATSIYDTGIEDDSETAEFTVDEEIACLNRAIKILKGVI